VEIGFVLMHISPLHEHEVFNKLSKIPEIIELHPLFGEYDLIAKIDANDFEELGTIIVNKIRSVTGVLNTKTLTGLTILKNKRPSDFLKKFS
jgi:DNA-binding Lrp family transcriptional regulator